MILVVNNVTALEIIFGCGCAKRSIDPRQNWALKHANWTKLTSLFFQSTKPLSEMPAPLDVETLNQCITQEIISIANDCIPKTSDSRQCHCITPWWDEEYKVAVADRKRAENLLWNHPTPSNLIRYKRCLALAKHISLKKRELE